MNEHLTFILCGSPCPQGHDFQGNRPILDDEGRVIGGETFCSRCGLGSVDYSLWTDE